MFILSRKCAAIRFPPTGGKWSTTTRDQFVDCLTTSIEIREVQAPRPSTSLVIHGAVSAWSMQILSRDGWVEKRPANLIAITAYQSEITEISAWRIRRKRLVNRARHLAALCSDREPSRSGRHRCSLFRAESIESAECWCQRLLP